MRQGNHIITPPVERGTWKYRASCDKNYIFLRTLRRGGFALPRVPPSAAARLSAEAPDVMAGQLSGRGLTVALWPSIFLLVVDRSAGLDAKKGKYAKARSAPVIANQKPGRAFAEAGKLQLCKFGARAAWLGLAWLPPCVSLFWSLSWRVPEAASLRREKEPAVWERSPVRW